MSNSIPIVNIQAIGQSQTLRVLDSACRNWGLFQVVGHGINPVMTTALFREMRHFFAQSRARKLAISRTRENPWGYYDQERTANRIDCKQVFDYGPAYGDHQHPQWPHKTPGFKPAVLDYYAACERLAFTLLNAIGVNLGVSSAQLSRSFQPSHTSFLRLNFYPGQYPGPSLQHREDTAVTPAMGLNAHTDAGALTVLSLDQTPGLEVWQQQQWQPVAVREDALVINLGDVVQVWSNDRYTAPLHRVVGSGSEPRLSTPFFLNPAYSANYAPLQSTVDGAHPPRYRAINWGEFRELRSQGDYADYGEEIQLEHYRTGA